MCDTSHPLSLFKETPGKQAGTVSIVEQVRGGRDPAGLTTCPGPSVWLWLWIPLGILALIGVFFCIFKLIQLNKGLKKGIPSDKRQYKEPLDDAPFVEDNYDDFNQGPKAMEYSDEPMPVLEPLVEQSAVIENGAAIPHYVEPGLAGEQVISTPAPLFGGEPNLMAGFAPTTVVQPAAGTFLAPSTYSQYTTGAAGGYTTVYPQASSMAIGGASTYVSRPAYGGSITQPGGALATQTPAYGAYGGYTVTDAGPQPSGSMRIG